MSNERDPFPSDEPPTIPDRPVPDLKRSVRYRRETERFLVESLQSTKRIAWRGLAIGAAIGCAIGIVLWYVLLR